MMLYEYMDVYYCRTKVYFYHFVDEYSQNVRFVSSFKCRYYHFETSYIIGWAVQQEPIGEHLSYVFCIYG